LSAWTLAVVAAVVGGYALVSRRLDRTPITAAIVFLSAGVLFGSKGLGWIDVGAGSETVRVLAEATLTLVLFADASRIDLAAPPRRWRLRAAGRERAFMRSG
jgi:NhaP-type Na+/H+ or K+/H+ antiporter